MTKKTIPAHQARVLDEKRELDTKRAALDNFKGTAMFEALDPVEQVLLVRQALHMERYSSVLGERLARWGVQW